jgi:hypothetical protein
MPEKDSEAVAEFIRTKGITRCPTACVLPTQGVVTAADRVALEEHATARDRLRQAQVASYELPPTMRSDARASLSRDTEPAATEPGACRSRRG